MISLIGFIIAVCAMAVLWNYFDRDMEELKVIKEREKVFETKCHNHNKKAVYCEDCMATNARVIQQIAQQNEHAKCCLHGREKVYCGGCLTVLQQHGITVDKESECYAHKKKNMYCEDCMKIAQNVAKQNALKECLTALEQRDIMKEKTFLPTTHTDQLEVSRHLCEQCSMARFGHVTTQLSGGLCECCRSKRIHWVRQETDAMYAL